MTMRNDDGTPMDAHDTGKALERALCEALNTYRHDEVIAACVQEVRYDMHRTIQQSLMRLIVALLTDFAARYDRGEHDMRNEAACALARRLLDGVDAVDLHLPTI